MEICHKLCRCPHRHPICSIAGCNVECTVNSSFHQFPKSGLREVEWKTENGVKSIDRREAWHRALGFLPTCQRTSVCNRHFAPEDFLPIRPGSRRRLKATVVPHLNLPKHENVKMKESKSRKTLKKSNYSSITEIDIYSHATKCCIPFCGYSPNVSYHMFPKRGRLMEWDTANGKEWIDRREAWSAVLGIYPKENDRPCVCSQHFSPDNFFKDDTRDPKFCKMLKVTAIPDQNLHKSKPATIKYEADGSETESETETAKDVETNQVRMPHVIHAKLKDCEQHCAVSGCMKNSEEDPYLSFYYFPRKAERADIRRLWILALKCKPEEILASSVVCSLHFSDANFLLGSRSDLKFDAVPDQMLPVEISIVVGGAETLQHGGDLHDLPDIYESPAGEEEDRESIDSEATMSVEDFLVLRCGKCGYQAEKPDMRDHFVTDHNIRLQIENLSFGNELEFESWLTKQERVASNHHHEFSQDTSDETAWSQQNFTCDADQDVTEAELPIYCPARILATFSLDGSVTVKFNKPHVGISSKINTPRRVVYCPLCRFYSNSDNLSMVKHFEAKHGIHIKVQNFKFETQQEFESWCENQEQTEDNSYKKVAPSCNNRLYLACSCDNPHRRHFVDRTKKKEFLNKGHCPARIIAAFLPNGTVSVRFFETHVGHGASLATTAMVHCPLCQTKTSNKPSMAKHFKTGHGIHIKVQKLVFDNEQEFLLWLQEQEQSEHSSYVKVGSKNDSLCFKCYRDGPPGKKMGIIRKGHCPARIIGSFLPDGKVSVEFFETHVGHDADVALPGERIHSCPLCKTQTTDKPSMIKHFETDHDVRMNVQRLSFESTEEFLAWRSNLEPTENIRYKKVSHTNKGKVGEWMLYMCFRCETLIETSTEIKTNTKSKSVKVGYCPAQIKCEMLADGTVSVEFRDTHVGHDFDAALMRITKERRARIERQIQLGIPYTDILETENSKEGEKTVNYNNLSYIARCLRSKGMIPIPKRNPQWLVKERRAEIVRKIQLGIPFHKIIEAENAKNKGKRLTHASLYRLAASLKSKGMIIPKSKQIPSLSEETKAEIARQIQMGIPYLKIVENENSNNGERPVTYLDVNRIGWKLKSEGKLPEREEPQEKEAKCKPQRKTLTKERKAEIARTIMSGISYHDVWETENAKEGEVPVSYRNILRIADSLKSRGILQKEALSEERKKEIARQLQLGTPYMKILETENAKEGETPVTYHAVYKIAAALKSNKVLPEIKLMQTKVIRNRTKLPEEKKVAIERKILLGMDYHKIVQTENAKKGERRVTTHNVSKVVASLKSRGLLPQKAKPRINLSEEKTAEIEKKILLGTQYQTIAKAENVNYYIVLKIAASLRSRGMIPEIKRRGPDREDWIPESDLRNPGPSPQTSGLWNSVPSLPSASSLQVQPQKTVNYCNGDDWTPESDLRNPGQTPQTSGHLQVEPENGRKTVNKRNYENFDGLVPENYLRNPGPSPQTSGHLQVEPENGRKTVNKRNCENFDDSIPENDLRNSVFGLQVSTSLLIEPSKRKLKKRDCDDDDEDWTPKSDLRNLGPTPRTSGFLRVEPEKKCKTVNNRVSNHGKNLWSSVPSLPSASSLQVQPHETVNYCNGDDWTPESDLRNLGPTPQTSGYLQVEPENGRKTVSKRVSNHGKNLWNSVPSLPSASSLQVQPHKTVNYCNGDDWTPESDLRNLGPKPQTSGFLRVEPEKKCKTLNSRGPNNRNSAPSLPLSSSLQVQPQKTANYCNGDDWTPESDLWNSMLTIQPSGSLQEKSHMIDEKNGKSRINVKLKTVNDCDGGENWTPETDLWNSMLTIQPSGSLPEKPQSDGRSGKLRIESPNKGKLDGNHAFLSEDLVSVDSAVFTQSSQSHAEEEEMLTIQSSGSLQEKSQSDGRSGKLRIESPNKRKLDGYHAFLSEDLVSVDSAVFAQSSRSHAEEEEQSLVSEILGLVSQCKTVEAMTAVKMAVKRLKLDLQRRDS